MSRAHLDVLNSSPQGFAIALFIAMEKATMISPDLSAYAVEGTDRVYYIPEFVTEEEESYLLRQVSATII